MDPKQRGQRFYFSLSREEEKGQISKGVTEVNRGEVRETLARFPQEEPLLASRFMYVFPTLKFPRTITKPSGTLG